MSAVLHLFQLFLIHYVFRDRDFPRIVITVDNRYLPSSLRLLVWFLKLVKTVQPTVSDYAAKGWHLSLFLPSILFFYLFIYLNKYLYVHLIDWLIDWLIDLFILQTLVLDSVILLLLFQHSGRIVFWLSSHHLWYSSRSCIPGSYRPVDLDAGISKIGPRHVEIFKGGNCTRFSVTMIIFILLAFKIWKQLEITYNMQSVHSEGGYRGRDHTIH